MENIYTKLEFNKIRDEIKRYSTSSLGKEKVDLLSFKTDLDSINHDLDILAEFKKILEIDEVFPIDGIKDIREALARTVIDNSVLQSKDLLDILSTLRAGRNIKKYFISRKHKYPLLVALVENVYVDKIIEFNIEKAIDENGNVRDSASKNLKEIRQRIISLTSQITKELDKILKRLSEKEYTQDVLITQRDERFVIPIKVEHKRHVPGFIHSTSATGATVFIEPTESLEMNNELRSLQFEERREIEKILRELTSQIRERLNEIRNCVHILAEIDFIYSKANYSIQILASKPVISAKGRIFLREAYHPILLLKHPRKSVIPLDFQIGDKFNTIIITGPNAGGKSVTLKTIGILCLMLQAGLLISASPDSEFRIFEKIFIDIGDDQSIENDLSTFSSHLLNLKNIIENANNKSLVLIDEIGEGTDPIEGGAIATAVLSSLSKRDAITIATTHQSSLKVFAHQENKIENGAMEFDQKNISPTYKYREGIPGSSYAIEIAKRLGIPENILSLAMDFIGKDKNRMEKMILDLENKLNFYHKEISQASKEKEKFEILVSDYEKKIKQLEKDKNYIKSQALEEAHSLINNMNSRFENIIKEIKESNAEKEIIKRSKEIINEIKTDYSEFSKNFQISKQKTEKFKIGDIVKLKDSQEHGTIGKIENKKAIIILGNIKFETSLNEIEKIESTEEYKSRTHSQFDEYISGKEIRNEIDVRGKYGAEAIPIIEKALDDAYVVGLNRVDIIHGKGTGALRKRITEYLKDHHSVKSFRVGELNEGGSGVTVVEINSNK